MSDIGLRSERGPILLALMLSMFLIAIDSTILSTAVPTIVRDLGGFAQFPWLFSIYLLAQAATVPVYAKLADTFGRKPIMLVGVGVFLVGSVLCATAWDMPTLIAFRGLQGIGAGAIMPTVLTIAGDIYTVRERARAQAYLSSVWAISAVVGPTLGGVLAQFASWRWIFWINLPLGLFALFLLWRNYRPAFERHRRRIDYAGAVLLTAALVLLVLGVLEGGVDWDWLSWQSFAVLGGGFALLIAFVLVERSADDPILAPWVFRSRLVSATALVGLLIGVVLIGLVSYTPTFLEATTGASPIVAGLAVAGLMIGWPISGALAGNVYLRIGFRSTTLVGSSIVIAGAVWLAGFAFTPSALLTGVGCFIVGFGLGFVANPSLIAAQSSVELRQRGVVSGTNALARSIGSSLGVAVFGAVANSLIDDRGGHETAAAVQAGAIGVYIGVAIVSVAMLFACMAIPHVPIHEERAR
ncbi:MDR family MFS transporter [Microbacterium sp.]|uniref:MDR family MFS transporter n=1 Tax=Microbacterium sp. TaxID=51671 RepID=UPI002D794247|nr:MDR family MFS transporter [Microbacterium sp.]HET6302781.1 MDR family MFS transporter [Microbacterium sp.]